MVNSFLALPDWTLAVIGGKEVGSQQSVDNVFLTKVGCPYENCQTIAPLPIPMGWLMGGWIDGHIVACGGMTLDFKITDLCFTFNRYLVFNALVLLNK